MCKNTIFKIVVNVVFELVAVERDIIGLKREKCVIFKKSSFVFLIRFSHQSKSSFSSFISWFQSSNLTDASLAHRPMMIADGAD